MKHSAVIFDLDGTLLDTLDDLTAAVNYALKKGNYPERTRDEVRKFVGNGMGSLIRRAVPKGTTWEESWEIIEPCNQFYSENCTESTKPYPGIEELLDRCNAKKICEKFFPGKADYVLGAKDGVNQKPAPDMIFEAMDAIGVEPNGIVVVGDGDTDVQAAKNAGVDCISVTWGFKDRYFLENHCAKVIVDTVDEVMNLL